MKNNIYYLFYLILYIPTNEGSIFTEKLIAIYHFAKAYPANEIWTQNTLINTPVCIFLFSIQAKYLLKKIIPEKLKKRKSFERIKIFFKHHYYKCLFSTTYLHFFIKSISRDYHNYMYTLLDPWKQKKWVHKLQATVHAFDSSKKKYLLSNQYHIEELAQESKSFREKISQSLNNGNISFEDISMRTLMSIIGSIAKPKLEDYLRNKDNINYMIIKEIINQKIFSKEEIDLFIDNFTDADQQTILTESDYVNHYEERKIKTNTKEKKRIDFNTENHHPSINYATDEQTNIIQKIMRAEKEAIKFFLLLPFFLLVRGD